LKKGPFTVTNKDKPAPSGDIHDYASYSRYWWPDPNSPNGLPYIRKDGETNPESQSLKESDRQRLGALAKHTEALALAYYFTEKEKYAKKVAELLRVWFLDKETRMNPNVNHAQCRPGHNLGSKSGVLDGRLLIQAIESSLLIANSKAFSEDEHDALKEWAKAYFNWLTTDEMALNESRSKNNHGSYYDVQAIYFGIYTGNNKVSSNIAHKFLQERLPSQIESDGSMPEELARTRPLFYSIYNLHAMFMVAHLAEKVGVDVWQANDDSSKLRAALDFLIPYADPNKSWPKPTIKEADRMEFYALVQMADRVYTDRNYLEYAEKLPLEKRKVKRSNLVIPLMR